MTAHRLSRLQRWILETLREKEKYFRSNTEYVLTFFDNSTDSADCIVIEHQYYMILRKLVYKMAKEYSKIKRGRTIPKKVSVSMSRSIRNLAKKRLVKTFSWENTSAIFAVRITTQAFFSGIF